ncbi:MAG: hypothetical protein MAG551_02595 [Candidatus Scalindua arabica]|uniref:RCK C-terminal domain-containing protein n=1 Tax=Candidatus Scalindua arabica TaxID=1127984 RepID=A0A941W559_9BACT|nr:hypothetical protein [Candidatus Scalindua arabica]
MTFEVVFFFILIGVAMIFFIFELVAIDITAIALLTILLATGYLDIGEAVAGFSNKAVITIGLMFILSKALVNTGVLEVLGDRVSRLGGEKKWVTMGILLVLISVFSGFINNTAAVAIFLPLVLQLCRKFKLSPSKMLIPLSFAGIYGGTLTLIGTSTNLLVGAIAEKEGVAPLGMFEFTKLGLIFLVVGTVYNLWIVPKILPSRAAVSSLTRSYHLSPFLTELQISADSPLINSTCLIRQVNHKYNVSILSVIRGDMRYEKGIRFLELMAGDILIVNGTMDDFMIFSEQEKLLLLTEIKMDEAELTSGGSIVVEALIPPQSGLISKTLSQVNFRGKFGALVLAIRREGATLRDKVAHTVLRFADTLLIYLPESHLEDFSDNNDLAILQEHKIQLHKVRFWWLAIAIIPIVMITAALEIVYILEAALIGVTVLLILKGITINEAYKAINWPVIIILAVFVPVGFAMEKTGAADLIGSSIVQLGNWFPPEIAPHAVLSFVYLVTVILTAVMSNNSTAIVLTPIVISVAESMGVSVRPFIFAVCYGASTCFMTPIGYQTNLMVYGPGNYRFMDFVKAGLPIGIIFWIIGTLLIPVFWPF